jgi:hypothetical protein
MSFPIYKIYDECHKLTDFDRADFSFCGHYVIHHLYDYPILRLCCHENNKVRLATYQEHSDIKCNNIWNIISDNLADSIRDARPSIPITPIIPNRVIVETKILDPNEIFYLLHHYIGGSSRGAYLRNIDTLETTQIIFDYDDNIHIDDIKIDQLLLDMDPKRELVVVMDKSLSYDIYVRKISDDKYLWTNISY